MPCVTVSSSGSDTFTTHVNSMIFMQHLEKLNFDLCSPRYSNSPQVSYLGMNPRRGWNPNLEGSYILEYSESEAEFWTQNSSGFYIRSLKKFSLETSVILVYIKYTKT